MSSESKQARQGQKGHWENQREKRLLVLKKKGVAPENIAKDAVLRKIRAEIRKADSRLRVITGKEKKLEEMAKVKADKAAAPKAEKRKKKAEAQQASDGSKRQQKKLAKKEQKQTDVQQQETPQQEE
jgi:hypothetical protein